MTLPTYELSGDSFMIPGRGLVVTGKLTNHVERSDLKHLVGQLLVWKDHLHVIRGIEWYLIGNYRVGPNIGLLIVQVAPALDHQAELCLAGHENKTHSSGSSSMQVEDVARTCHEANRAYCLALGDTSQPAWDLAPAWQRQSAINGVTFHLSGHHEPSESHEAWLAEKVAQGWVYGEVKDAEKKTHPCCVPYDKLPKEQQAKDYIFAAIVKSLSSQVVAPA